jgi:hypothetical protein
MQVSPFVIMVRFMKRHWKVITLVLLFVLIVLGIGMFMSQTVGLGLKQQGSLAEYAKNIVEKCAGASYRPSCYDEEIPKLMNAISMEKSFEVTRLVQNEDSEYFYCHILGHELSTRETAKDPDNWKKVIARCPSSMCSNGCIHGAFQERFRAESLPDAKVEELKPVLTGICEKRPGWEPTGLEKGTCYHALGHLSMYITDGNIERSTALCKEVVPAIYSQICFDGAFMQIFQPLEPEDFALVKDMAPIKEELFSFCNEFPDEQKSSCWSEGWPLYYNEIITPEGLVEFCSKIQIDGQENRCYNVLFYVVTAQFALNEERVMDFCSGLVQERMGQCFANASSRMIETDARLIDRSLALCAKANVLGVGEECYEELLLYSIYNFHVGSQDFFQLCNALPDPWNTKCLNRL